MAWGGAAGGSWGGGGGIAAECDPGVVIDARAERWAVERARERGGDVGQLERVAVAAEARAWRASHPAGVSNLLSNLALSDPPNLTGDLTGNDVADSAAWRREQEQAASERGQLGAYQEVYGRAPGAAT